MPDPVVSSSDAELRARVDRVLSSSYELDEEIGRGGMGVVYRARDRRLKRQVAIKLLPPELAFRGDIRTRFLREAETAAQLNHPNIVPIHSVDERDGLVFFVMAYVEGENLAKRVHVQGRIDGDEVRRILRGVADALAYAHARGVVHRDIKPDNILLDERSGRPMVTDFGIARALSDGDSRLTATGVAIGTPAYMSPEQSAGDRQIDGRTDLYSLGVVAYQMLSGELPFDAPNTPAMLVKHIAEQPAPIEDRCADVPADLARIVMRLLEKDPACRYESADQLVAALDGADVPDAPASTRVAPLGGFTIASRAQRGAGTTAAASRDGDLLARWSAEPVRRFRHRLAPFIAVNFVIILVRLLGGPGMLEITALWSVWLAYRYAKLWSDGYDWRDVFKQPRDRLFVDVAAESLDAVRSVWDPKKRAELRARERGRRRPALFSGDVPRAVLPSVPMPAAPAAYAATVRQAEADRDEIARLVDGLPAAERRDLGDAVTSASALAAKIRSLAVTLEELDLTSSPAASAALEQEIAKLEAEANPLDGRSEDRVRRLARLRRERRRMTDMTRRRADVAGRLESCRLALQTMRYDLVRLRTGGETHAHVTSIVEQAMSLARDVDGVLQAGDEVARSARTARGRHT